MGEKSSSITALLIEWNNGSEEAKEKLIPLIYKELRKLAQSYINQEAKSHTLQATTLVNELYLRLIVGEKIRFENKGHFFALAARQMRRILIDHARGKGRDKRGKGTVILNLDEGKETAIKQTTELSMEEMIDLDEALNSLAKLDIQQSQIVEAKFYGGLTIEEIAGVLNISSATVEKDWKMARAWLHNKLKVKL